MRLVLKEMFTKNSLLCILSLLISLAFLFPLYWILCSSFKGDGEIFRNPPTIFPRAFTLEPYVSQLTGENSLLKTAKNSFIIATVGMCISFLLAVPAAYGVTHFKFPGSKIMILIFLVTQMLPASLLLTPLFLTYNKLHILNTYLAPILSVTTITIPFTLLVLRPMFMACPAEIVESARIEGCNEFSAFMRIVLPTIKPGLITVCCFGFVQGWNDLVYSLTFNSNHMLWPMTTTIYNLMNQFGTRWNLIMAYGCILVTPPVLIFIFAQKYIISGLTSGAVKG